MAPGNVLCHNSHLMGHFKFLHGSTMTYPPLNISEKLHQQHLFEKLRETTLIAFIFVNTMQYLHILKHSRKGSTIIFSFVYQACTWPNSSPFCQKNSSSGCNSGIHLVLEYTLFQLCSNAEQISEIQKIQENLCKLLCCCSNYCQNCSVFLFDFFCSCLSPMIVHL